MPLFSRSALSLNTLSVAPILCALAASAAFAQTPVAAQTTSSTQAPAAAQAVKPADIGTTTTDINLQNVIFGAGNAIPTGDRDTVVGVNAGAVLTTGREMTIFGANACAAFSGNAPGVNSAAENGLTTCIGSYAGGSLLPPSIDNVFVGQKAGVSMTTGSSETIIGVHAGTEIVVGNGDTIVGAHTLDGSGQPSVNSYANTLIGAGVLNGPGTKNFITAVGWSALPVLNSGAKVIALGTVGTGLQESTDSILMGTITADLGTSADNDTIIGNFAGRYAPAGLVTVGNYSAETATARGTFVGFSAGGHLTSGQANACFGANACSQLVTGSSNTIIGDNSGSEVTSSESGNTIIGANATTTNGVNNAAQIGPGENRTSNSLQFHYTTVVDGNNDIHAANAAPASNETCTPGAIRVSAPFVYACVAPNTWMRAQLSTY